MKKLVAIQYNRNNMDLNRSEFRVRGDVLEIFPASYSDKIIRVEMFGDEIERICGNGYRNREILHNLRHTMIFPASHYVTEEGKMKQAVVAIEDELDDRLRFFEGA